MPTEGLARSYDWVTDCSDLIGVSLFRISEMQQGWEPTVSRGLWFALESCKILSFICGPSAVSTILTQVVFLVVGSLVHSLDDETLQRFQEHLGSRLPITDAKGLSNEIDLSNLNEMLDVFLKIS